MAVPALAADVMALPGRWHEGTGQM